MRVNGQNASFGELPGDRGSKAVSRLQAGERFKAAILDIKPGEITIQAPGGKPITAKCQVIPEAHIGDVALFEVRTNENGQVRIRFVHDELQSPLIDIGIKALEDSALPTTPQNIQAAHMLLENQVPIDTAVLEKAVYLVNAAEGIDLEKMLAIIREGVPDGQQTAAFIAGNMHQGFALKPAVDAVLSGLSHMDPISRNCFAAFFQEGFSRPQLEAALLLSRHSAQISGMESGEAIALINRQNAGDTILAQLDEQRFQQLWQFIAGGGKKEALKLVQQKCYMNIREQGKAFHLYHQELLERLTAAAQTLPSSKQARHVRAAVERLAEGLRLMDSLRQTWLLPFPYIYKDLKAQSNLYVFNRGKGKKALEKSASVAITLDLANLGHVEVFIQKDGKQVSCHFRVEDENKQGAFKKQMDGLVLLLKEKGYQLNQVAYDILETPFSLAQKPPEFRQEKEAPKRFSFDMRV